MKRSADRILTTHAGRLPNPSNIADIMEARAGGDQERFDDLVSDAIAGLVRKQIELQNDLHSDGEFWKARDGIYYDSRSTGIEMKPVTPGEPPSIVAFQEERRMPEFRGFYEIYDALGNVPFARSPVHPPELPAAGPCGNPGILKTHESILTSSAGWSSLVFLWIWCGNIGPGRNVATKSV